MTGIEILAVQEIATGYAFNWIMFWTLFSIIFGGSILLAILISFDRGKMQDVCGCIIVGFIIGAFLASLTSIAVGIPVAYETQYKVTTSDEVPINEFLEKYEIINQEGKIYTVRERNQEDLQ